MSAVAEVTVIVVTYNSAGEVEACLRSVREHAGVACEIIVVDNASVDGTVERVRNGFPDATVIANTDNRGFSGANNQALALARAPYVYFLNPDTELRPGALPLMLAFLKRDAGYSGVGPKLVNRDGRVWRVSARRLPNMWTEFSQLTALDRMFPASPLFAYKWYEPWDRTASRDVECLTGAALLCRTEEIRRLGGYDVSVPLYLDDMDLCRRLRTLGRLHYLSDALVLHHHDVSGAQQPHALIVRLGLQATYRYFQKHEGALTATAFAGMVLVLSGLAGVFALVLAMLGRHTGARRERTRCRVFAQWAVGSKAGPWLLPRAPAQAPAEAETSRGLFPNLG